MIEGDVRKKIEKLYELLDENLDDRKRAAKIRRQIDDLEDLLFRPEWKR